LGFAASVLGKNRGGHGSRELDALSFRLGGRLSLVTRTVPDSRYEIRVARPEEYGALRSIEEAADSIFADVGIGPFQQSEDDNHLAQAAVVFASGNPAVGFACVELVDGAAHIWQVSVHPRAARQGRGRALLNAVCDWATVQGLPAVTLTTFRDVAWNGPFYAKLGFRELQDLTPGLASIRDHERSIGDDNFGPRIAMRKDLT
jgi:GNAT superfamily N-acetyltransferase